MPRIGASSACTPLACRAAIAVCLANQENGGRVFAVPGRIGDKRSASVNDLGDLDLKLIRDLLTKTKDALLLARLLDVLSVRERKRADTEAAIDSYLAAVDLKNTQDPYVSLETEHLLTRC